jgi:hypothetical protein
VVIAGANVRDDKLKEVQSWLTSQAAPSSRIAPLTQKDARTKPSAIEEMPWHQCEA